MKILLGIALLILFFVSALGTLGAIFMIAPLWMAFGIFCMMATMFAFHSVISL